MNVAIIPARAGSAGVKDKNVRPLGGLPLLAHTINHAREAQLIDRVIVTTDGDKIAEIATEYGAEVIRRPPEFATATATSESALLHAVDTLAQQGADPDLVVFLQVTSPFRRPRDIDAAIEEYTSRGWDSLLSVAPNHRFLWQWGDAGRAESINYDHRDRQRRQDLQPQFVENGSIYVFRPEMLRKTGNRLGGNIGLFAMDEFSALEIDTPLDFAVAEAILTHWQTK